MADFNKFIKGFEEPKEEQPQKAEMKPYKTIGQLEHYITPYDEVSKKMMGNPKANFTIRSKKVGEDWDLGSASGLDFETEDEAKRTIDQWESYHKPQEAPKAEPKPNGYYKDEKGEIYMMKDGQDYYPVGEKERSDFFTAFNNQNKAQEQDLEAEPKPLFDEYKLSTKEGIEEAQKFLGEKGIKDPYSLNNEQFNALADEAAKKYGIDRELAQEFLVAPYDEKEAVKPQPKQGSFNEVFKKQEEEKPQESEYKPKKDYGIYGEILQGDERKHMAELAKAFNEAGLDTIMDDYWQDYGAGIEWTSLVSDNVQTLTPREWGDYMSGRISAQELVEKKKNDPFWAKRFKEKTQEQEFKPNAQADNLIKRYYDHEFDLEQLHNQLIKVFGGIKPAFEYLLKRTGR